MTQATSFPPQSERNPEQPTAPLVKTYEFEAGQKVQNIGLDLYSLSGRIEGKAGKVLPTKPVQMWNLIEILIALADRNELSSSLDSIHVAQKDAFATLSDIDKAAGFSQKIAPIGKWTFEKVLAMIDIPNIGNDLANARIGLTLNKEGLSVAFGMNLWECTNFNIMGGQTVLRTYKHGNQDGIPWEVVEVKLERWMASLQQMFSIQTEWMDAMKQMRVADVSVFREIFGQLYVSAIQSAYPKLSGPPSQMAPFDTNELSRFAQEAIRKNKWQAASVWDLYNWGTSIMKPETADIGEIANNSAMWAEYLVNYFGLDVPEYEILN